MPALTLLAQGSPGEMIEPLFVPCCGAIVLVAGLAFLAVATSRSVGTSEPSRNDDPQPAQSEGTLNYATPRRHPRRKWVFHPYLGSVVVGAIAIYAVAAFGYAKWNYRTRTTTILLIDAKTGLPITTPPSNEFADGNCPGFEETITHPVPGSAKVSWNHPCVVVFVVPGYSTTSPNGMLELDDTTPAVVTLKMVK